MRTDERAAAFLALGLAKGGQPVPIVTTSGTAVANLHPAILEAAHAGVPLLALTADRPPRLRDTGANQTTRQVGIFGQAPRWSYDLGTPDSLDAASWRAVSCRAWAALTGPNPGPVHLNVPFTEPLVPDPASPADPALGGRANGEPWLRRAASSSSGPAIICTDRTLMLLGDLPTAWGPQALAWAEQARIPVLAEPTSSVRGLPHGPLILGDPDWLAEYHPEHILVVGRLTLSRAFAQLLRSPGLSVDAVTGPGSWSDPAAVLRRVYPLESLLEYPGPGPQEWLTAWNEQAERVAARAEPLIRESWPSALAIAQIVADTLSAQFGAAATLFVGPSSPIRDVDLAAARLPTVIANRGLAGIDGCLSTAVGLALANSGPHFALVGDLTFMHDLGAWLIGPAERRPNLTVVVVNDDGGGIFGLLEPGEPQYRADFDRVFGTPLGVDLAAVGAGLGLRWVVALDAQTLVAELRRVPAGITVVEVRVPRGQARALHARLRQEVG